MFSCCSFILYLSRVISSKLVRISEYCMWFGLFLFLQVYLLMSFINTWPSLRNSSLLVLIKPNAFTSFTDWQFIVKKMTNPSVGSRNSSLLPREWTRVALLHPSRSQCASALQTPLLPLIPQALGKRWLQIPEPICTATHISPCHHLAIIQWVSLSRSKKQRSASTPPQDVGHTETYYSTGGGQRG